MTGDFRFCVCVIASHPETDVSELATRLGRIPAHVRRRGAPVETPAGTRPGGTYFDSRCLVEMASDEDGSLAECVALVVDALEQQREFIEQLKGRGGDVEVFARWYPDGDTGESFPAGLLARLGSLGVRLGFNVYGHSPAGHPALA